MIVVKTMEANVLASYWKLRVNFTSPMRTRHTDWRALPNFPFSVLFVLRRIAMTATQEGGAFVASQSATLDQSVPSDFFGDEV